MVPSYTKRDESRSYAHSQLDACQRAVHTPAFGLGLYQSYGFVVNYLTVGRGSRGFAQSGMTLRKAQIDGN
jgi:hypothetical protein